MEKLNIVCCPICDSIQYFYKFVNNKEILLCNLCGHWENYVDYNSEVDQN
jgi:uncharacterized protein YbaR (Trm112 family)